MSVFEGDDYSVLREMLSNSRRKTMSQSVAIGMNSNVCSGNGRDCQCQQELTLLKDTVASLQADILMLKQTLTAVNETRVDQVKIMTDSVSNIKSDMHVLKTDLTAMYNDTKSKLGDSRLTHAFDKRLSAIENDIKSKSGDNQLTHVFDKRLSAIEKFLDGENIHVVSLVNDQIPPKLPTGDRGINDYFDPFSETNTTMIEPGPVTVTPPDRVTDILDADISELELFLKGHVGTAVEISTTPDTPEVTTPTEQPNESSGETNCTCHKTKPPIVVSRSTQTPLDMGTELNGYKRKRSKRYFVGGYDDSVTKDFIANMVSKKGPKVTMVRKFQSRRQGGKVVIRLNVEADDKADLVLNRGFWPRGITCRPWLSKAALRRQYDSEATERDYQGGLQLFSKKYAKPRRRTLGR